MNTDGLRRYRRGGSHDFSIHLDAVARQYLTTFSNTIDMTPD